MDEEIDGAPVSVQLTMVAAWADPAAVDLLEAAIIDAPHLKPLWERIRVHRLDGRACIGLPIAAKVTDDNCDNHARHFFSLLRLLGVPLVPSPMALERVEFNSEDLAPLFYVDPKAEKERLKAEAAAAAAAAEIETAGDPAAS